MYLQLRNSARSSVEAARSSLVAAQNKEKKNPQKISQLEAALDKAKQGFVSVGEECCEWLHFVTSVVEADLIENLCDYLELYRDFFQVHTRLCVSNYEKVYSLKQIYRIECDTLCQRACSHRLPVSHILPKLQGETRI
jgi:hypothetical protein